MWSPIGTFTARSERYQVGLEIASVVVMMLAMLWFGVFFWHAPNPITFERISDVVQITPPMFGVICFIGMLAYPFLLLPRVRRAATDVRWFLFMLCAAGLLLYVLPVAFDTLYRILFRIDGQNPSPTPFIYLAIAAVILAHGGALYTRYSRRLELAVAATLFLLFVLAGAAYAFMPQSTMFHRVNALFGTHLVPMTFALWCIASGLGYLALPFLPLKFRLKRFAFALLTGPSAILSAVQMYNLIKSSPSAVQAGAVSWFVPLAVIDLCLLLILLGCALYRRRAPVFESESSTS